MKKRVQKMELILERADREYEALKEHMMESSKREIWDACGKIHFYGLVKGYLDMAFDLPAKYRAVLEQEKRPLSALWEVYSDSDCLGYLTWEEIEEVLDVMVEEAETFAA